MYKLVQIYINYKLLVMLLHFYINFILLIKNIRVHGNTHANLKVRLLGNLDLHNYSSELVRIQIVIPEISNKVESTPQPPPPPPLSTKQSVETIKMHYTSMLFLWRGELTLLKTENSIISNTEY